MGRAARLNPCSYAGGKRLPDVVTARTKRQFQRDGTPEAMELWAKRAKFTDAERAWVRSRAK